MISACRSIIKEEGKEQSFSLSVVTEQDMFFLEVSQGGVSPSKGVRMVLPVDDGRDRVWMRRSMREAKSKYRSRD